jgi:hypothetical protein
VNVQIDHDETASRVTTNGLAEINTYEISIAVQCEDRLASACLLARELVKYIETSGAVIQPEQTLTWASWLVKFVLERDCLCVYEADVENGSFLPGADKVIVRWDAQSQCCTRVGAAYDPPSFSDFFVVAPGVLKGEPINGVRYPYVKPNSGWWFFCPSYPGDLSVMRRVHLYDVYAVNESAAAYVGLPSGYCFDSQRDDIWFDDAISLETPV